MIALLAMTSSCSDEETESSLPKHIVSISDSNNQVVLLDTSPAKDKTTTINLTNDLAISSDAYITAKNEDLGVFEIIYFANRWAYAGRLSLAQYNPKSGDLTHEDLPAGPEHQYLRAAVATSDYIMVLSEDQKEGSVNLFRYLTVYDRNSKTWKDLELCENCGTYSNDPQLLLKDGKLFTFFILNEAAEGENNVLEVLDAATLESLHTFYLESSYPKVIVTDSRIDIYDSKNADRYMLSDFTFVESASVNFAAPSGISSVDGNTGILGIPQSQPSSYNSLPAVVDMSTLKVLKQFGSTEIAAAQNIFGEKMDLALRNISAIVTINPKTEFVLWSYWSYEDVTNTYTYGFIFSDYSAAYNGHTEFSYLPRYSYLF